MYEINGIVYADNSSIPIEVIAVKALPDMILLLTFNTGEEKIFDAAQLLNKEAFRKLLDENIFLNPSIEAGVVTWDNGSIDIAPEALYINSSVYNKKNIISA